MSTIINAYNLLQVVTNVCVIISFISAELYPRWRQLKQKLKDPS